MGVENSPEVVVFYRDHGGPTRNLAGEGFSRHLHQKTRKIRPSWRGMVSVYRSNQTSEQPVFDRFSAVEDAKSRSFRTGFSPVFSWKARLRRRFIAENNLPIYTPVPACRGHQACWGGRPSGGRRRSPRPVPLRQQANSGGRVFAPGFSSQTEDSSYLILHDFLDRLTTSAFTSPRVK